MRNNDGQVSAHFVPKMFLSCISSQFFFCGGQRSNYIRCSQRTDKQERWLWSQRLILDLTRSSGRNAEGFFTCCAYIQIEAKPPPPPQKKQKNDRSCRSWIELLLLRRISVSVSESVFVPRMSRTSGMMTWTTENTGLTILLLLSVLGKTLSGPIWSCNSLTGTSGISPWSLDNLEILCHRFTFGLQ